nr:MAG TPA_asm: hypothetical protein [Caudoviricetes sp.]
MKPLLEKCADDVMLSGVFIFYNSKYRYLVMKKGRL